MCLLQPLGCSFSHHSLNAQNLRQQPTLLIVWQYQLTDSNPQSDPVFPPSVVSCLFGLERWVRGESKATTLLNCSQLSLLQNALYQPNPTCDVVRPGRTGLHLRHILSKASPIQQPHARPAVDPHLGLLRARARACVCVCVFSGCASVNVELGSDSNNARDVSTWDASSRMLAPRT